MHEVENIIPVFPVRDLEAAKTFYRDCLGFTLDWDSGAVCSLSRDGHCLMLSVKGGVGRPALAWMGLETDALMRLAIEKGLEIEQEPRNESFAYHMKIKDIDGNILWLGTERKGSEQDGGGQPSARSESKSEEGDKPQPESEGRSR
jgi:predicted lactoylglutathione lyase